MTAKDLRVAPISSHDGNLFVKSHHYSGKVTNNVQMHLGVFIGTRLEGCMQFGPPLDRRKLLPLVTGTVWNSCIELNRMVFTDRLPRNSESRALGVAMRMLRRDYTHIEWVVSFADGTQCGDGTIYRAAGFVLTGINPNKTIWGGPEGERITDVGTRTSGKSIQTFSKVGLTSNSLGMNTAHEIGQEYRGGASMKPFLAAGFKPLEGFQMRYIFFVNPAARARLTVPVLDYSEIKRRGAAMYRGVRGGSNPVDVAGFQSVEGGSTPTPPLHSSSAQASDSLSGAELPAVFTGCK